MSAEIPKPRDYALFIEGIPDSGLARIASTAEGRKMVVARDGTAGFRPHLPESTKSWPELLLPLPSSTRRTSLPNAPLINHMADADLYGKALRQLDALVRETGLPCFNAPAAVLETTRDKVAERLGAIAGVRTAKTVRIKPERPGDFPAAAKVHGLNYPVLARLTGTQSGLTMMRIDNADDWDKIFAIPWGGAEVYLSEFIDFADSDGVYRKIRLVMVGGETFVRSRMASRQWLVNADTREDPDTSGEPAWLAAFDTETLPALRDRLTAIAGAIGLDYFGIDCATLVNGDFLVFEANASMTVLQPSRRSDLKNERVARIRSAVIALLQHPARWRRGGAARAT